MSGMGAFAAALQGGMEGFLKGTAYVKGQERDEEDKKFRQEQRALMTEQMARQRKDWATQDAIEAAAAPTAVQENTFAAPTNGPVQEAPTVTRFDTAGATFANRGEADAAAKAYNAPLATMSRMRDAAAAAGKVDKAHQYGQFVKRLETEGFVDFHRANMPTGITADDIKAGKVPDADVKGLEKFNGLGSFKIPEGAKLRYTVDDLGRPDYMVVDKDGKQVTNFTGNTLERMYDYGNYVGGRKERINQLDKEADNKRDQRRLDITEKYYTGMLDNKREAEANRLEIASMRAATARAGQVQPPAPVWNEKADETLLKHYTVLDPTTGAKDLDGDGLQFGKTVALARARGLGGDTTMGIGFAVAKDAALKKAAGGDPEKLRQLRAGYLASISGQGAAGAQPPQQPAAVPAPAAAPRPSPSIREAAQQANDPLADNPALAERIGEAVAAVQQAQQQAAAAARSGDARVIIQYGNAVNAARANLERLTSQLPNDVKAKILGGQ